MKRHSSSRSLLAVVSLLLAAIVASVSAADFSKYTVISGALKNALRTNWQSKFPASGYTSGNVAVYGNSITYTSAFWRPFAWGAPGIVPGTNLASYTVEKGPATCAYTGYQIGDGLACVASASNSLKPEVAICEYGTNDIRDKDIGAFRADYERYLDILLDKGIIPIIGTIPPMRMNNDASYDAVCAAINDTIRLVAQRKNVVLVEYWKAMMDCSGNNPFSGTWMDADMVHPAGGCTLTDTANPQCGYAVRNAVCWHAVNKVYRIIIENGPADDGARDTIAPSATTDLAALSGPYSGCVTLSWTAPGNDGTKGTATAYELKTSEALITATTFAAATSVATVPRPLPAGSAQTCMVGGLTPGKTYYFALRSSDGPNRSAVSNVVSAVADSRTPLFADSTVLSPTADTYLEAGSDAGSAWGTKPFIRIKSGGQGIPLLRFAAASIPFTPDSAILYLTVAQDMPDSADYSYQADVCGVTVDWDEATSCFNLRRTGVAWSGGDPSASFDRAPAAVTKVSFTGTKSTRTVHPFPLPGIVARGLAKGNYTSIAIYETGASYNNCHFSSREGSAAPRLVVYKKSATAAAGPNRRASGSVLVNICETGNNFIRIELTESISRPDEWSAALYTCSGRLVRTLPVHETAGGGVAHLRFDAGERSGGAYIVQLRNHGFSIIKRVTFR